MLAYLSFTIFLSNVTFEGLYVVSDTYEQGSESIWGYGPVVYIPYMYA